MWGLVSDPGVDNYDSFTFNLVHYLMELGVAVRVERNDALSATEAMASGADAFLISPGPGTPDTAGISLDLVAACADAKKPLLGVCLGHQSIGQHFRAKVVRGGLMHGKTSPITHDGTGVFDGLPAPLYGNALSFASGRGYSRLSAHQCHRQRWFGYGICPSGIADPWCPVSSRKHRHRTWPRLARQLYRHSRHHDCGKKLMPKKLIAVALPDPSSPLSFAITRRAFAAILDGQCEAAAITSFLIALAQRGETAEEIAAAAQEMRAHMIGVEAPVGAIDVCGTGGDNSNSLNISTATALVVAACDIPMAKHGNRAASSKSGTADTLEVLGLDLQKAAKGGEQTLREIGIGFFFAPNHHPALGPLAPIRRDIARKNKGSRTIFNLLGPLCNPAQVKRQLIGVASPDLIARYARAAAQLDYQRLMIVSGEEGLDELSISGPSRTALVNGDKVSFSSLTPEDAGLPRHSADAIRGGDANYNAAALSRLLEGEPSAYRDAVLLNSAAALIVAGEVDNLRDGVEEAAEALDKGLAKALLDCWIANQ